MLDETVKFCQGYPHSIVKDIRFVVFNGNKNLIDAFQQEASKIQNQGTGSVNNSVVEEWLSVIEVANGDLTKETTDAIVNINSTNLNMNSAGELGKAVAKASGPQAQQECSQLGPQSPGSAVMTSGGNLKVRHIIHIVPGSSDKTHLQQCLEEGLRLADKKNLQSISIPAIGTGGYGLSATDSAEVAFQALRNASTNFTSIAKVRIVVYQTKMVQAFQQEKQKLSTLSRKVVPHSAIVGSGISIDVINGDLTKETTDAIVNINSSSLNMNDAGELGKAVAKASGPQVQQECSQLGPQSPGAAVMTSGGNLKVRHIIHIVPGSSNKAHLQQCLEEGLREADKKNLQSISIPAIGTGGYGLSATDSAEVTFQAVRNASVNFTSISEVRVVVFQAKMMHCFQQEQQKDSGSHETAYSPAIARSRISVDVINGDITLENTDVLLNILNTDMNMNTAGQLSRAIAKAGGQQLQQECYKLGKQSTGTAVMTTGGNLNVSNIIHIVPGSSDKTHLQKCLEEALRLADTNNLQSISIPAIGTGDYGLSPTDSATLMFKALSNFSGSCVNVNKVRIVIFQVGMVKAFQQEKEKLDKEVITYNNSNFAADVPIQHKKPGIRLWFTGKRKSIDKAIVELKETFSKACPTKQIKNEDIGSLSQRQINNLQREAYKSDVEIKFDKTANCVTVRGYRDNVPDIVTKITDEIKEGIRMEKQKQENDYASAIARIVEWSYERQGKRGNFDLKTNAKLEMASTKKESSIEVSLLGKDFVIDLKSHTGRCRRDGEQVKVCRRAKEGKCSIYICRFGLSS